MASKARGEASAAPTTTSPPKLWPTATTGPPAVGPQLFGQGQQVLDVPAQIGDAGAPGTLVAPAVVGHRAQLGEAPHDPPEALAPVERSVDENDRGSAGRRAGPRRDLECGRIGHGQGRRYPDCPPTPTSTGRVGP